jgi:hypothetical protein
VVLIVAGVLVVLLVFLDAFMTTLAVSVGAGPVSSKVLALCWRVMLKLHRTNSRSSFLTAGGTVLLTLTVLLWVAGLWLGWALIFVGSEAVVSQPDEQPAGWVDAAYFSGFVIFTLGTGDFGAATPGWRLASVVASFSGLFLVTLAITYLISVIAAVVLRRSLALAIEGLGSSADDIVVRGWDGARFSDMFEQQLINLTPQVVTFAQNHLAYPVLHYFHAEQPALAAPVALAKLEDAMMLLDTVDPDHRPDANAVHPLRFAMERYIDAATDIAWVPHVSTPASPDVAPLRAAGIPLVDDDQIRAAADTSAGRRAELNQLVTSDGWTWKATVEQPPD